MRRCVNCGRYTLKEACPVCGSRTVCPHPPRFSPVDKYVSYRVSVKYLSSGSSSSKND
jgi:H/ACA ribonucleoprotein complex subunit 3